MSIWRWLTRRLHPTETPVDQVFSLGDRGGKPASEEQGAEMLVDAQLHTRAVLSRIDRLLEAAPRGKEALQQVGDLSVRLDENLDQIKALFRLPQNKDLIVRELLIATRPPVRAALLFMEGLTEKEIINSHILQPLMLLSHLDHHVGEGGEHGPEKGSLEAVKQRLLPGGQVSEKYDLASVAEALLAGDSVLLLDGARAALAVETKSPPTRSVSEPRSEPAVWGPQDAFNEAWRVNVALVRRRLKDPRVVTEVLTVGELSGSFVGMMYIDTIAPPKLVAEVKRRVEAIKVDVVNHAGVLEQYIEEHPGSIVPTCLVTERPDRAAAYLAEGHVALFVDNSPFALIAPATLWSLMQAAEDYYLRWPFGSVIRWIRLAALIAAMVLPALYISVINYHQEMIPTELMLFIASTREPVPLPALVELLLMDLAFELIREASTRIPGLIGPTIGLVSSLILGQAAVEAKIVSPLMILVVAFTGLASFAISNYMLGWGVRACRFILLALASVLGFFGVAAGLFMGVILLASQRSFGVPYLAPVAPARGMLKDVFARPHLFDMEERPPHMRPLNKRRQADPARAWDPITRANRPAEEEGG